MTVHGKKIILGVTGGIAAYKACELVRLLVKENSDVHVIMSDAAREFVTPLTFETLSRNKVHSTLFEQMDHITLADEADLVVIAPATADFIAKAANGLADDLLSTLLLATKAPVLVCPAMNVNMWRHPAVQANLRRLKELNYSVLKPASGELACGWEGKGRLPEPNIILEVIGKEFQGRGKIKSGS